MVIIVLLILIGLSVCLFLFPFAVVWDAEDAKDEPKKMPDSGISKSEFPVGTYRIKPGFRSNVWVVEQYCGRKHIYEWNHIKAFSTEKLAETYIREQIQIKKKEKEDKERWERVKQENPPRTVPPYRFKDFSFED